MLQVAVHLDCYQKLKNPIMSWKCELCEDLASRSRSPSYPTMDSMEISGATIADCALCGGGSGAFRKTADGRWVHAFCAEVVGPRAFFPISEKLSDNFFLMFCGTFSHLVFVRF